MAKKSEKTESTNDGLTVVGVERDSTHSIRVHLSDGRSGSLMACGEGSAEANAKWRAVVYEAMETTFQSRPDAIPAAS